MSRSLALDRTPTGAGLPSSPDEEGPQKRSEDFRADPVSNSMKYPIYNYSSMYLDSSSDIYMSPGNKALQPPGSGGLAPRAEREEKRDQWIIE